MLQRLGVKTDNNPIAFKAKVAIRRNVLAAIALKSDIDDYGIKPSVFDAFAGSGEMFSEVWKDADSYTGCDLKPQRDSRLMFCADNRRVMRAIDLTKFSLFDFDAWGSAWEQCVILADRRKVQPDELIGIVITDGAGFTYKMNEVPAAISILTGLRTNQVGLSRNADAMVDRAIAGLARRMNCNVAKRWQAKGNTGAVVRYIGLVLSGSASVARRNPG